MASVRGAVAFLGAFAVCAACSGSEDKHDSPSESASRGGAGAAGAASGGAAARAGSAVADAGGTESEPGDGGRAGNTAGGASGHASGGATAGVMNGDNGGDSAGGDSAGGDSAGGDDGAAGNAGAAGDASTGFTFPDASDDFLFYASYVWSGYAFAVDPLDPTAAPIPLGYAPGAVVLPEGVYNAATQTVTQRHSRRLVKSSSGRLWLTTLAHGQAPVTRQISSEHIVEGNTPGPKPTDLCGLSVVPDWENPNNSRIFYALAGADNSCVYGPSTDAFSDLVSTVRLGDDEQTPPLKLSEVPVTELRDTAGAISGWLSLEQSCTLQHNCTDLALVRHDADFGGHEVVVPDVFDAQVIALSRDGRPIIRLSAGSTTELRTYDASSHELGPALLSTNAENAIDTYCSDPDNLYFYLRTIDPTDTEQGIYRLPLSARSTAPAVLMAHTNNFLWSPLHQTDHALFFLDNLAIGNNVRLKRLEKTATNSAVDFVDDSQFSAAALEFAAGVGSHLYMQQHGPGGEAMVFNDSGALENVYPSSNWLGYRASATLDLVSGATAEQLLLVTDGQAYAVNGTNPAQRINLGAVGQHPYGAIERNSLGYRRELLLRVDRDDAGNDLLFVDVARAGSLRPLGAPDATEKHALR